MYDYFLFDDDKVCGYFWNSHAAYIDVIHMSVRSPEDVVGVSKPEFINTAKTYDPALFQGYKEFFRWLALGAFAYQSEFPVSRA